MKINRVGQTARNSTSLQRAPGAPTLSVKGDPTNYPFWPGYKDYNETSVTVNSEYFVVKIFSDSQACAKIERLKIHAQY